MKSQIAYRQCCYCPRLLGCVIIWPTFLTAKLDCNTGYDFGGNVCYTLLSLVPSCSGLHVCNGVIAEPSDQPNSVGILQVGEGGNTSSKIMTTPGCVFAFNMIQMKIFETKI